MTGERVGEIVGMLSEAERAVMLDERFDPKGWEPMNPASPLIVALVELGLFRRADGRCGFEAFKDSFIVPTELGLAVRASLKDQSS